jgi:hypothetical protein
MTELAGAPDPKLGSLFRPVKASACLEAELFSAAHGSSSWSPTSLMLKRCLPALPDNALFSSLLKYFCAWLDTWIAVFVVTKYLDMFFQSPRP